MTVYQHCLMGVAIREMVKNSGASLPVRMLMVAALHWTLARHGWQKVMPKMKLVMPARADEIEKLLLA